MYLDDLFGLKGKKAVIIGGGGVLAGAISIGLAKAGADTAILGRTLKNAQKRADEISAMGHKSIAVQVDASSKEELKSAHDEVIKEFGQIDILINSPGINSATPFFDIQEEEWYNILDVNLKSMFLTSQIFTKSMIDGNGGCIINMSSASSEVPLSKVFTYSISKAGVNTMTKFLAREFAQYDIRVNALIPGFFPAEQNRKILTKERTDSIFNHTPMNRFGNAEELVGTSIWLASEKAASFVTGALIKVDGGFTAQTI